MKRIFTFFLDYRLLLLLIYLFLLQYFFLRGKIAGYQLSNRETYIHGKELSKGLVYVAFIISLLYPLIVWLQRKKDFKKNIVWLIVGFLPALYYIVLFMLSYQAN